VWYTGQFYALTFIQKTCNIEFAQSNYILLVALLVTTPFFILFGAWSDRVGRKVIMLTGMLLAILLYRPIYTKMYSLANLKEKQVEGTPAVTTKEDPVKDKPGDLTRTTTTVTNYTDGTKASVSEKLLVAATPAAEPAKPEKTTAVTLPSSSFWLMIALVAVQVLFVTMVYGPIAAFLVELFPTRIRYTSMSLPYHIGNGVFGGLTPFIATRLVDATKNAEGVASDPLAGLWYPIIIGGVCFVIGLLYLSNRIDDDVTD
jgi:MHS family proline/betaine transporter-like MFS transporter